MPIFLKKLFLALGLHPPVVFLQRSGAISTKRKTRKYYYGFVQNNQLVQEEILNNIRYHLLLRHR